MSDADTWRSIPQEIFTDGREDLIDEYFGVDYVEHAKLPPGIGPGREGFRQFVSAFRSAFPDGRYEVLLQTQDGDLHTGLVAVEGTMTGDFLGMPASGKKARWEEMHIGRFRDGKLVEHWGVQDGLSMLQQLGFAQAPGA
jgi:predicted ester cyclase